MPRQFPFRSLMLSIAFLASSSFLFAQEPKGPGPCQVGVNSPLCQAGALPQAPCQVGVSTLLCQVGVFPPEPNPVIPAGDDIILYVHGGPGSRLEEASDLVNPLLAAGLGLSPPKTFTIISFDQPSQGYSTMKLPAAIVPAHTTIGDYYPMVQAEDEFIAAFVNQLAISGHNIFIVGGSTGGMLALRMAARANTPWLKKVVAWNPASVWTTYHDDVLKGIALTAAFCNAGEISVSGLLCTSWFKSPLSNIDDPGSRKSYFDGWFGSPTSGVPGLSILDVQPNPEEWYRGDRDKYPSDADTSPPFATVSWPCKWDYIGQARVEQQEIYNQSGRLWHYRLGTEELLFSFFNNSWVGPARNAEHQASANYMNITKPTLLMASDDDDWNEGYVSAGNISGFGSVLTTLGILTGGGVLAGTTALVEGLLVTALASGTANGSPAGPVYFPWENRWTQTRKMAPLMQNTPGQTLFLENTGHSIHNERPQFLASQIATFVSQPTTSTIPNSSPNILSKFPKSSMPAEQACQTQLALSGTDAFPQPIQELLNDAYSAKYLMEPAIRGGNFSDNNSAGTYSLRLRPELREDFNSLGNYQDYPLPNLFLASAAVAYYSGGPGQGPLASCTTALKTGLPGTPPSGGTNPPGGCIWGNAFADLAVTGRTNYESFRRSPPMLNDILKIIETPPICAGTPPTACLVTPSHLDPVGIDNAIQAALTRAYQVAWALRNPNPQAAYQLRNTLGWIAVSGEDDPPARPVNVSSGLPIFGPPSDGTTWSTNQVASYPQYEVPIAMCTNFTSAPYFPSQCPGNNAALLNAVPFQIRYSVAGLPQISNIRPPVVPVGSTTPVTISGAHLVGVQTVSPQGFSFTMNSPTQISLNVPPDLQPGSYAIQLNTTVAGVSYSSLPAQLDVAPVITGISPWSGPITGGTPVTITGNGLAQFTEIRFGSVPAKSQCFTNSCTVVTPQFAQPGPVDIVAITNNIPSATVAADVFRYTQYPELVQFSGPGVFSWADQTASPLLPASVSLNGYAPAPSGTPISLYSSDPNVISVQPITVKAGSPVVNFTVRAVPFTSPVAQTAWIIAEYQNVQIAVPATVPPWPPIFLSTDQILVSNGQSILATVTLNSPAPNGGANISLSVPGNGNAALFQPFNNSLNIKAGQNSGTFTLTGAYSGIPKQVTIVAKYNGQQSTRVLSVGCQPPSCLPGYHVQGCGCVKGVLPNP